MRRQKRWIRISVELHTDPVVLRLASRLGLERHAADAAVGLLARLWSWCWQHLPRGEARDLPLAHIDTLTCCPGLAEALVSEGWVAATESGWRVVDWERWFGTEARQRELAAARMRRVRERRRAAAGAPPSETRDLLRATDREVVAQARETNGSYSQIAPSSRDMSRCAPRATPSRPSARALRGTPQVARNTPSAQATDGDVACTPDVKTPRATVARNVTRNVRATVARALRGTDRDSADAALNPPSPPSGAARPAPDETPDAEAGEVARESAGTDCTEARLTRGAAELDRRLAALVDGQRLATIDAAPRHWAAAWLARAAGADSSFAEALGRRCAEDRAAYAALKTAAMLVCAFRHTRNPGGLLRHQLEQLHVHV